MRVRSFALCTRGHGGHIASEAFRVRSHGLALLFWISRLDRGPDDARCDERDSRLRFIVSVG
ncbi:hypothetical protein BSIN_3920 [Burkholderia singularis]|uniref:Uncharacterized protein n=1 Tax=Burkholderia singularis TaxID=1503053 RepID=A0A238H6S0_9BURK|nr:hypothetical protein BSIN_3920 [Burkholderia singularis]